MIKQLGVFILTLFYIFQILSTPKNGYFPIVIFFAFKLCLIDTVFCIFALYISNT